MSFWDDWQDMEDIIDAHRAQKEKEFQAAERARLKADLKRIEAGEEEKEMETHQRRRFKCVPTIQDTIADLLIKLITVCFLLLLLAFVDIILTPVLWLWIPLGHHGLPMANIVKHLFAPIAVAGGQEIQWWESSIWLWAHHPGIDFWAEQVPFIFIAILLIYKTATRQTTRLNYNSHKIRIDKYENKDHIGSKNLYKSTAFLCFIMFFLGLLGGKVKNDDFWW